jgi:hypothetical protein
VYGTNNSVSTSFVDRYRSVESSQKNLTGIWRDFVHMILLLSSMSKLNFVSTSLSVTGSMLVGFHHLGDM